ncbi:GerAB/ArcD/ProY family transporter [Ectobacillus ponti]|uniref:Spore germination protein n=1 Tax=Ectobacillus ponti TaxID=2961894 RepID=A0AA42BR91_9BACI|nr:GerAB/ArcD/ProY family transporter [Ectobacillus ponti]MCP8969234.1 spore germination protein [Ectobacillus ponti]
MKEKLIPSAELFCLLLMFQLGSAALVDIGRDAGTDAWIAVLAGTAAGLIPICLYILLHRQLPSETLVGMLRTAFGTYAGGAAGVCYIVYFLYTCSRVLRDFGSLLILSAYPNISPMMINLFMMLTVVYVTSLGMEVWARMSIVITGIIIATTMILVALEVASGIIHPSYLKPFLENGWKPIFRIVFPQMITFPFGETVAFLMLFPYVWRRRQVGRTVIGATLLTGLTLSILACLHVTILGAESVRHATFPILTAVSLIDIGDFLERLDAFVVIVMVLLGFSKIMIFFAAALLAAKELFSIYQPVPFAYLLGAGVALASSLIATNFAAHLQEGLRYVPYVLHLPMQFGLPLLLLAALWMKNRSHS